MKARTKAAFAGMVGAFLTGCSALPAAPSGVLTGKAWPCVGIVVEGHPVPSARVTVFSGEHRVASQTVPAGSTYRIKLRPGRYVVSNNGSPSSFAHQVSVSSQSVTRMNLPDLCP